MPIHTSPALHQLDAFSSEIFLVDIWFICLPLEVVQVTVGRISSLASVLVLRRMMMDISVFDGSHGREKHSRHELIHVEMQLWGYIGRPGICTVLPGVVDTMSSNLIQPEINQFLRRRHKH